MPVTGASDLQTAFNLVGPMALIWALYLGLQRLNTNIDSIVGYTWPSHRSLGSGIFAYFFYLAK